MWRRKLSLSRVKISDLNIFIHSLCGFFPRLFHPFRFEGEPNGAGLSQSTQLCTPASRWWPDECGSGEPRKKSLVSGLEICGRSRVKLFFSLMKTGTKLVLLLLSVRDFVVVCLCAPRRLWVYGVLPVYFLLIIISSCPQVQSDERVFQSEKLCKWCKSVLSFK